MTARPLPLLACLFLIACPDAPGEPTPEPIPDDTLAFEDPTGVTVSIPASALPEGLTLEDVSVTVSVDPPDDLPEAALVGATPWVTIEPVGVPLSEPITIVLPPAEIDGARDHFSAHCQHNFLTAGPQPITLPAGALAPIPPGPCMGDPMAMLLIGPAYPAVMPPLHLGPYPFPGMLLPPMVPFMASPQPVMPTAPAFWPAAVPPAFPDSFPMMPRGLPPLSLPCGIAGGACTPPMAGAGLCPQPMGAPTTTPVSLPPCAYEPPGSSGRDRHFPELAEFEFVENPVGDGVAVRFETTLTGSFTLADVVLDADRNGIHDGWEGLEDPDEDGVLNHEDWDNDGDRVADELDGGGLSRADMFDIDPDPDGDGLFGFNDADRDDTGPVDGIAECEANGGCACALRNDGLRFGCFEGDEPPCEDIDFGLGLVEYEVMLDGCPDPAEGEGATCRDVGELDAHFYGDAESPEYTFFCANCEPGTVEPAGFCPPR